MINLNIECAYCKSKLDTGQNINGTYFAYPCIACVNKDNDEALDVVCKLSGHTWQTDGSVQGLQRVWTLKNISDDLRQMITKIYKDSL